MAKSGWFPVRRSPRKVWVGDKFPHKCIEGLSTLLDTLAAAVAVIGKSNDRCTKFIAVDSDVKHGKENGY